MQARQIRAASRFLRHRFRELHPFEVQAALLNACNLKCQYCFCPEVSTQLLTTAQWREIIRGLGRLGTMRIKFQGGEPTLRNDFRELCAEAKANGIVAAVITNGMPIASRPELLDFLDEIIVSFDATRPELNDRLRGDGAFQGAVAAIDLARRRGIRVFVNMVVTKENYSELEAMLDFCEARGTRLNAQAVQFTLRYYDKRARDLGLADEQFRELNRKLAAWRRQGRSILFSPGVYEKVVAWPDLGEVTRRSEGVSSCMAGEFYVHIDPNGDVHPCVQHGATLEPKNAVRDGLEAALRQVRRHDCGDCFMPYLNERKELFGLRPAAVWSALRRAVPDTREPCPVRGANAPTSPS